jgi:hypothetical protein
VRTFLQFSIFVNSPDLDRIEKDRGCIFLQLGNRPWALSLLCSAILPLPNVCAFWLNSSSLFGVHELYLFISTRFVNFLIISCLAVSFSLVAPDRSFVHYNAMEQAGISLLVTFGLLLLPFIVFYFNELDKEVSLIARKRTINEN